MKDEANVEEVTQLLQLFGVIARVLGVGCCEVMQVGGCSMLLQNVLRQPGKDVI